MQIKLQKLLEENDSEYGYTEIIRALRKVHIVKLKFKEKEHLARTEVHGAAAMAFKAVGLRVPERVQTNSQEEGNVVARPIFEVFEALVHKGFRIWGVKRNLYSASG